MARVRFPPLPDSAPPPADPPSDRPTTLLIGRRQFLKLVGAVAALAVLPWTRAQRSWAAARGRFFTRQELATLEALCDRIIPPDDDPGARGMGAARYIETLLTAFDRRGTPRIFAGGPFSGRTPFPNVVRGEPSRRRPANRFKHFVPLSRIQELRWRADIFGSAAVPGSSFNDATLGPLVGLRQIYRDGLARVDALARTIGGNSFTGLAAADQDKVVQRLDADPRDPRRGVRFFEVVIEHTLEGCFSAPEYGGNHERLGWRLIGLEGDSQPLGYSVFSKREGRYHELSGHPLSRPNPDELGPADELQPKPLSEAGATVQLRISSFARPFEGC
jgi:hypothetical protein